MRIASLHSENLNSLFMSIFGINIITSKDLKQNFEHEVLVLFTFAGIVIFPRLILPPCLCSTSRISLKEKSSSFIKTRLCAQPLMDMKIRLIFFWQGGGGRGGVGGRDRCKGAEFVSELEAAKMYLLHCK